MKKIIIGLSFVIFVIHSNQVDAYSRTKRPITKNVVALGSVGIGLATGVLTKLFFSNNSGFGVGLRSNRLGVGVGVSLNPLSGKWSTIAASLAALTSTWIGWKALSSYTASGYFRGGQRILSGEKCSEPEVLDLLKMNADNPERLAKMVVDHFSARKNELAKSVNALESLFNQLLLANYYFEVVQRRFDAMQADLAEGFCEIIADLIVAIKSASMLIKSHEDYQRQYEDELKERKIAAQYATAQAVGRAADAAHVHYHCG